MNQQTKKIILDHLNDWMEENDVNTSDLKTGGRLPVSGRWVDTLRQSVRDQDDTGFNTKKVKALLKEIELPYRMDGSQLIVNVRSLPMNPDKTPKDITSDIEKLYANSEKLTDFRNKIKANSKEFKELYQGNFNNELNEIRCACGCPVCEGCEESEDVNEVKCSNECEDGKPHFFGKSFCLNCGVLKPN